jgi:phosphoribosylglycinamide formyltransferase 2
VRVIPTARAARLTMDREGIRRLAAETLGLPTSPYKFCDSLEELQAAIDSGIGYPCIVKPVMSSSGKGQSKIDGPADVQKAWDYAMAGGRVSHGRVIVEGFIDFDYEITLLTVRAKDAPAASRNQILRPHRPRAGERRLRGKLAAAPHGARPRCRRPRDRQAVTANLGGQGLFGVELFVKGDEVWFSEVSPRPHDTGMVTMARSGRTSSSCTRAPSSACRWTPRCKSPGASAVIYGGVDARASPSTAWPRRCACRAATSACSASPRVS